MHNWNLHGTHREQVNTHSPSFSRDPHDLLVCLAPSPPSNFSTGRPELALPFRERSSSHEEIWVLACNRYIHWSFIQLVAQYIFQNGLLSSRERTRKGMDFYEPKFVLKKKFQALYYSLLDIVWKPRMPKWVENQSSFQHIPVFKSCWRPALTSSYVAVCHRLKLDFQQMLTFHEIETPIAADLRPIVRDGHISTIWMTYTLYL